MEMRILRGWFSTPMIAKAVGLSLLLGGLAMSAPAWAQDDGGEGGESADVSDDSAPKEESPTPAVDDDAERAGRLLNRELRTVEEDVNRLKERVFRSKATLQLLKELVIEGATMGSRVVVWHINKMGPAYTMESVQYFLNGKNIYSKMDPAGSLDAAREVKIHEQSIPPGTHNMQVNLVLRGNGFGVFSYLKTYSFKVQSSYSFKVQDGRVTVVRVLANERPGFGRTFVDRPSVQYDERQENLREE